MDTGVSRLVTDLWGMRITGYNNEKVVVENKVVTIRSLDMIYSALLFGSIVFVAHES